MSETVRIRDVELRAQVGDRVLYRITDDQGERYMTRDMWMAGLCQRAKDTETPVRIHSRAGWFYRDLTFVKLVDGAGDVA